MKNIFIYIVKHLIREKVYQSISATNPISAHTQHAIHFFFCTFAGSLTHTPEKSSQHDKGKNH